MKKVNILKIFIVCIILQVNVVQAYDSIKFKNITNEDGISQGTIETMIQDKNGYIWFGTNDGLNRYNGNEFKVYKHDEDIENTISDSYIVDLKEDKEGNIWVGTTNGLSKINTETDIITSYYKGEGKGNLSHSNIGAVLITKDGDVILGTSNGIDIYNRDKDEFESLNYNKNEFVNKVIMTLAEDVEGNIWAGTRDGLNKINIETGKVNTFYLNEEKVEGNENIINKVYYDEKGYIWVGSYTDGLSKINIYTNETIRYVNDSKDKTSLPSNSVRSILRDSNNKLWVGSSHGISLYDEENNNFITYNNEAYDKNSLVDNDVYTIIEDSTGLIWVGTYAGISMFNPNNKIEHYKNDPLNENSLKGNLVNGIYEDNEGFVWLGSNTYGINILDRINNTVDHLDSDNYKYPLSNNTVNDIVGIDNEIFIGTKNGLNRINKETETIKIYTQKDGLANSNIRTLFMDSKGYLWIGTSDGVSILDRKNDEIINITKLLGKKTIEDSYTGAIFEDSEGEYWIGGFIDGGLTRINPNNKMVEVYKYKKEDNNTISSNSIRSIEEDGEGNLWIGTDEGLNKLDKKKEQFKRYKVKDGLSNNTIYGILIDDENNPWVSTNLGISKLDVKTDIFEKFGITDGLQGNEFNGQSFYKNSKGDFLFGGTNGLNIFNPKDMKRIVAKSPIKVIFDEFEINGEVYKLKNGEKLKNNENYINIKFFLPDYKDIDQIQYYYKLEGVNKEWKSIESNETNYSNLSPGKYIFSVVARNHNGEISEENKIEFIIKPHILESNIAMLIYITMAIVMIFLILNKVKLLDDIVEKRTAQLSDEMKKSNNLLNKVIELEKNKNAYFINLSHELRTPLNVIYASEQLIRDLNKCEKGIDKQKLNQYMQSIGRNSKRLLSLINNLIDKTKIEHGNYKIDLKKTDIVYVVEEAALSLKEYAEDKGIELIIDPEIEEKLIKCDAIEIERCIVNLISNAIKFTPDGGKIEVVIKDLGGQVKIDIIDNGIGLDKKYHESIFNRFNQVVDVNSEVKGGSGLGLTITKSIIEMHGGIIYVESEVNKGSTFTVIL